MGLFKFANKTANIKYKKPYQFTTPSKSDQVAHSKQHKSFYWDNVMKWTHGTYIPLDAKSFNFLHYLIITEVRKRR